MVEEGELGRVRNGASSDVDFYVDRDGPRAGCSDADADRDRGGVLFRGSGRGPDQHDDAPCFSCARSQQRAADMPALPSRRRPGWVTSSRWRGRSVSPRYGAIRVTHVGRKFMILDWAFQTDPGNPELSWYGTGPRPDAVG